MRLKSIITVAIVIVLIGFLGWRFIRPMNIFVVDDRFAWPVDTSQVPPVLGKLSAEECGGCHKAFYDEWRTTIHSQAWTDPYFQADWKFEDERDACRLCHTPLDRQQPQKVLGYRDKDKWDPILEDNPDFDPKLQHEGVTCAACHYRDGKIVGVLGNTNAPHPVKKLEDPNQVCVRCHVVEGERWDTFFRFPPCGTVAEINSTRAAVPDKQDLEYLQKLMAEKDPDSGAGPGDPTRVPGLDAMTKGKTGEVTASSTRVLGCVQCHMPAIKRPLVAGGAVRNARQHLWRGGHDPEMVRKALTIAFVEEKQPTGGKRRFQLTLANTGAAHYVPTGTPDRHLTVYLRLLDEQGRVLDEQSHKIIRTLLWRPVIVDLWDTRLPRWQPRQYELEVPRDSKAVKVEAEIRYYLVAEKRRKRIGYENKAPLNYEVFRKQIRL
ncbi:MAG: hypothetical protein BMS9Abin26_1623 [Gammaproteobacteria bacterium]|nr:MAG: hypothetical protein BMS9Abin26_1623 [Gammaproteobacteria bacterium]